MARIYEQAAYIKVFWFFSSEKNIFPSLNQDNRMISND
jgi:hypothetical protein